MNPYHRTMRADARHLQSLAVAPIKVIAALATLMIATVSAADVRPLASRPHAVRGEPLLVPITVEGSVRESISVRLESANEPTSMRGTPSANTPRGSANQTVSARILWPNRAVNQRSPAASVDDQSTRARWATACNDLRLSSARQSGARDAYLAIDVPIDARDGLRIIIDGATVSPVLHDAASVTLLTDLAVRASALVPSGALDPLLSLPDPLAPFERFRFEIGGALRGWNKPNAFVRASPDDIAARATSALWRAALARIAASSVGTATELAELLVAQCQDEFASAPIAAWIADPRELGALLALIFDPSRSNEQMVEGIVSWMRVRAPLLVWIDNDDSESITLALGNPSADEQVVRLQWLAQSDAPLAAVVAPSEVVRVRVPRPIMPSIDGVAIVRSETDVLRLEHRGQVRSISVPPTSIASSASGVAWSGFRRPLDLVSVATGTELDPDPALRTYAALRPRLDGWEIFVEARTATQANAADRVIIVSALGDSISIAADGTLEDVGNVLVGAGGFEFRSYADRFRASFVLPAAWIERTGAQGIVGLGFRRVSEAGEADAPYASVPWRASARVARVDILSRTETD